MEFRRIPRFINVGNLKHSTRTPATDRRRPQRAARRVVTAARTARARAS